MDVFSLLRPLRTRSCFVVLLSAALACTAASADEPVQTHPTTELPSQGLPSRGQPSQGQPSQGLQIAKRDPLLTEIEGAVQKPAVPAVQKPAVPAVQKPAVPAVQGSQIELVNAEANAIDATSKEALEEKSENVATELRVAMLQEKTEQAAEDAAEEKPEAETTKVDLLKQIEVTVAQQKAASSKLQDIESKKAELEVELSRLSDGRLNQKPPYSILFLDQLRDSLSSGKARKDALEASLLTARDSVERARARVDEQATALRQTKEKVPADDPKLKAAELDLRLAEETLVLRRQELAIEDTGQAVRSIQQQIDEKKIEIVGKNVEFSNATRVEQLAEIDARETSLKRKKASLNSEIKYAEDRWMKARQEMDSTSTPTPVMIARVDALNTVKQTSQLEETVINQRLQRFPNIRMSWERRFRVVAEDYTREERNAWVAETTTQLDLLSRERRSSELKLNEVRVQVGNVDARLDAVNGTDPELKRWLVAKRESLAKQVEIYNDSILAIDGTWRVLTRLQIQISGEQSRSFKEITADTWASTQRVWNYELANVDDTSLTVGKTLSSLMLLFFGYFAARWISRLLGRRLPNLGVDEAGADAIQSLSFYVLLITFALMALKYASVPLTAFAFLGGAIAIGIGFGSQNILNNFISGLILLAERPIKVGDLILIDSIYGNVTTIGARSTQIRTGENQDIIVPNSKFLENNVVNLTRRDDRLRTSIVVGVAYGSPLESVVALLEQAATEHTRVHAKPKPFVWFNDFADNSLIFQVHFWINARSVSQMKIAETGVRLSIDRLFRENGIVIAFPQRDLHIQSPKPIEFRLVGNEEADDDQLRKAG